MPTSSRRSQPAESQLSSKYLRQIANCVAYLSVQMGDFKSKSKGDLMPILASFGFDNEAIASILDSTPESVSARRSQLKAEAKTRKNKPEDVQPGKPVGQT